MKVIALLVVLIHARLAFADSVINVNKYIDQYAEKQNDINTKSKRGLMEIPGGIFGKVVVSKGVQVGLNSLYRSEDCTLRVGDDKSWVSWDIHLGYRLMVFGFGSVSTGGADMSALYRVNNNSANIGFTVHTSPCRVEVASYGYERLADVESWSSLPQYDRKDETSLFTDVVLPKLNSLSSAHIPKFTEIVQKAYCTNPHEDITDPSLIFHVL